VLELYVLHADNPLSRSSKPSGRLEHVKQLEPIYNNMSIRYNSQLTPINQITKLDTLAKFFQVNGLSRQRKWKFGPGLVHILDKADMIEYIKFPKTNFIF
jgi:hypothetical protein